MVRTCLALVLIAACGSSKPAPPPAPAPVAPPPPAPAAASCTDAGVILRGEILVDEGEAGPAKEKAIAKACVDDAWPRTVIDCIASTPQPEVCLDKLDARRRLAYDQRMQVWSDEYGANDGVLGGAVGAVPPPPIPCEDAIGDGDNYRPPAKLRPWAQKQRRDVLVHECEHGWSESLKSCLETADDPARVDRCLAGGLSIDEIDELGNELAEIDQLAERIDAAKKRPATITCKKVVEAHYGAVAWKQKLDGFGPDERKQMIAASRSLMTKACAADKWDDTQRACLVVGGAETCFAGIAKRRWGYPATGTVTSLGIAECDAYSAEVTKLTSCSKMDAKARDSVVRSQQQMLAEIARVPAAERARKGSSCKAAMESIETILTAAGC